MNRLLPLLLLCGACNTPATPPPVKTHGTGEMRIQVQRLENAQAEDVAKVLEETLTSQSANGGHCKIAVDQDHNALILSGTTDQIQKALNVVARLDSRAGR